MCITQSAVYAGQLFGSGLWDLTTTQGLFGGPPRNTAPMHSLYLIVIVSN